MMGENIYGKTDEQRHQELLDEIRKVCKVEKHQALLPDDSKTKLHEPFTGNKALDMFIKGYVFGFTEGCKSTESKTSDTISNVEMQVFSESFREKIKDLEFEIRKK